MCFYDHSFFIFLFFSLFLFLSLPAVGHGVMACRLVSWVFLSCYRFSLGF